MVEQKKKRKWEIKSVDSWTSKIRLSQRGVKNRQREREREREEEGREKYIHDMCIMHN